MPGRLLVVGGGRMGGALMEGLLARGGWAVEDLVVVETDPRRRAELVAGRPGLTVADSLSASLVDPDGGAILAVKPDGAEPACHALGAVGVRRVLSVVAGLPAQRLEACLPAGAVVVRAMPNVAALVGAGVTAMAGGSNARSDDLGWAETILGAVGLVVRVAERQLDAVTGLSGSGPAYVALVAESLIEAGVLAGLSRELSHTLTVETLRGAAVLMAETGQSAEALRHDVTSPGGSTAAGLRALEARAVRSAFLEAVLASVERARNLAR